MAVDGLQDGLARGQGDLDFAVEDEPQLFEGLEVQRVADDDLQRIVFLGQREDGVFAGDRFGHQFDDFGRDLELRQIDELQAVLFGHRPHDFLAGGIAEFHEAVGDIGILLPCHLLGLVELIATNDPAPDQDFSKIILRSGHSDFPDRRSCGCRIPAV